MTIYEDLMGRIEKLKKKTPFVIFGESELGSPLVAFVLGNGERKILIQASIHAREYITSFMAIRLIEALRESQLNAQLIVVPVMNPDGVRICDEGADFIKDEKCKAVISKILKTTPKRLYKANANGVDLNCNFDAGWGTGSQNKFDAPSFANFVGFFPNSENEVQSLISLTKSFLPNLTLSLHTKGEVVYFGYAGQPEKTRAQQQKYLKVIEKASKYKGVFTTGSGGGYKDYCLLRLDITGFTIEFGSDKLSHPISLTHLDELFDKLYAIVLELLKQE